MNWQFSTIRQQWVLTDSTLGDFAHIERRDTGHFVCVPCLCWDIPIGGITSLELRRNAGRIIRAMLLAMENEIPTF